MRIEKVGGNRKGVTVSCLRRLCFSEEKKMRFSGGEMVFYRMKIKSKTANVAKADREKCGVDIIRAVRPGDIYDPLPKMGLRGWCRSRHIYSKF